MVTKTIIESIEEKKKQMFKNVYTKQLVLPIQRGNPATDFFKTFLLMSCNSCKDVLINASVSS